MKTALCGLTNGGLTHNLHLPVGISLSGTRLTGVNGFIESFVPGEVSLFVDCSLPSDGPITVEFNGACLEGEILSSLTFAGGSRTNILVYDSEESGRRRNPRFPVVLPARVYPAGSGEAIKGTIVDISQDGLGLELTAALAIDSMVAIESETCTTFGLVRHCRRTAGIQFRIGISMVYVMRKKSKRFWDSWLNKAAI